MPSQAQDRAHVYELVAERAAAAHEQLLDALKESFADRLKDNFGECFISEDTHDGIRAEWELFVEELNRTIGESVANTLEALVAVLLGEWAGYGQDEDDPVHVLTHGYEQNRWCGEPRLDEATIRAALAAAALRRHRHLDPYRMVSP